MYGVTYNQENNTLSLDKHDCGLLSNASVTFKSLLSIHESTVKPIKIFWPHASTWNKSDRLERNVYDLYFKTINNDVKLNKQNIYFNAMIGECSKFNFSDLAPIRDTYFNLADEVNNRLQLFIQKYNIDFEHTISILYRGTDKLLEVPKVHPQYYLKNINLINGLSNYKILIQTDEQQVLDYFKRQLKDQSFYIEEMPLAKLDRAMHLQQNAISNYELGVNYLAVISILSKCKYVIFDTNNASLWTCIFRGSINNTCQIYANINILNKFEN